MKVNKIFLRGLCVAIPFIWCSCSPEQSELKLDDIKTYATISGQAVYHAGQAYNEADGAYTLERAKPASGRKVFVEVKYDQYKANAQSTKIFETIVDDNGNYSISIPVKPDGITASIRMEDFVAGYSLFDRMLEGKPVFRQEKRLYSYTSPTSSSISLKPGSLNVHNVLYTSQIKSGTENLKEKAIIKASVFLAQETGFRQGTYVAAAQRDVNLMIKDLSDNRLDTIGVTTDAQGDFMCIVPLMSLSKGFEVSNMEVLSIGSQEYKHYTGTATLTLPGAYTDKNNNNKAVQFTNIIDGSVCDLRSSYLPFEPYYNSIIAGQKPETWNDNLAGWVIKKKQFESFKSTSVIQGKAYLPYEVSYLTGGYQAVSNTTVSVSVTFAGITPTVTQTFVTATAADGTYQITIPTPVAVYDNFTTFIVDADMKFYTDKFTHYTATTNSQIEGYYSVKTTIIDRKNDDKHNIGSTYFSFTPRYTMTPAFPNLPEWYVVKDAKPVLIKGAVKQAVELKENSVWIAGWQATTGTQSLEVTIDNGETYDVPCINGNYSFTLQRAETAGAPGVKVIVSDNENLSTFSHHSDISSDDAVSVTGNYIGAGGQSFTVTSTEENGTKIYTVTPSVKMYFEPKGNAPTGWYSYSWTTILNKD